MGFLHWLMACSRERLNVPHDAQDEVQGAFVADFGYESGSNPLSAHRIPIGPLSEFRAADLGQALPRISDFTGYRVPLSGRRSLQTDSISSMISMHLLRGMRMPVPAVIMSSRDGLPAYITDVACSPCVPAGE